MYQNLLLVCTDHDWQNLYEISPVLAPWSLPETTDIIALGRMRFQLFVRRSCDPKYGVLRR